MDKSEIKILIVEDDPSLGRAIQELFHRAGYEAMTSTNPESAMTLTEQYDFHALIIDCMLPKINGVDLAVNLCKTIDPKPLVLLMTGVFKDKHFMKEAIAKTGAIDLLHKPFDLEHLIKTVTTALNEQHGSQDLEPILSLLTLPDCPTAQLIETMNLQSAFHAYHLPLVFSLFSRQGMTGELTIISSERDVSHITYLNGQIVDVRSDSKATQIGELLIEYGFAMPEDVEEALEKTNPTLPLGTRLVEAGALSPHAVGLIREEQLAIRLSQLIGNTSVEIAWSNHEIAMSQTFHALPASRLKRLLSEWVLSKIPGEWLRQCYLPLTERSVVWRGKAGIHITGAKANMPLLPIVADKIATTPILQDLLVENQENEIPCLQAIHTLILERKIRFGEKRRSATEFTGKINRYEKLLKSFKSKDYFQVLGVSRKARPAEAQRAYTDLAKRFHPDVVPPDAPDQLRVLCQEIFVLISNANDALTDDLKRKAYLEELSRKEASRAMEMEPQFHAAIDELEARKYSSAARKFDQLIELKAPMPDLLAYTYWAKLKGGQHVSERDFFDIPPESRHSAPYLLAKGLFYKRAGQLEKAMDCFQNARFIDKNLVEVRREINDLNTEDTKTGMTTLFHRLLGTGKQKRRRGA